MMLDAIAMELCKCGHVFQIIAYMGESVAAVGGEDVGA